MNDNAYIKKAVELADGWEYGSIYEPPFAAFDIPIDEWEQWKLDALAAQLVRQVDATDRYSFFSHRDCATVTEYVDGYPNEKGGAIKRDDRTMNTIKAIVDSEVLAATEQGESDG